MTAAMINDDREMFFLFAPLCPRRNILFEEEVSLESLAFHDQIVYKRSRNDVF